MFWRNWTKRSATASPVTELHRKETSWIVWTIQNYWFKQTTFYFVKQGLFIRQQYRNALSWPFLFCVNLWWYCLPSLHLLTYIFLLSQKKSHYMQIIGINIFYARLIWKGPNSWNNKYKGILIQILHYQVFKLTSHDRELVIQNQYLKEKPEVVYNNLH